jgi:DNA-directed RNA polymerase subunit L
MNKLLNAYIANPTLENAVKLAEYDAQHPMASIALTNVQAHHLRLAIKTYRKNVIRQSMRRSLGV